MAVDRLMLAFLKSVDGAKQVVSLGAGSDTRFWRVREMARKEREGEVDGDGDGDGGWIRGLVYHEMDFPTVVRMKARRVGRWRELFGVLGSVDGEGITTPTGQDAGESPYPSGVSIDAELGRISSPGYYLHPIDLRSIAPGMDTPPLPASIDPGLPTLLISECCLVYLPPSDADNILKYFTTMFTSTLAIVLYEPIKPDDAFGKVMVRNLAARGIVLRTLRRYGSLGRQRERLRCLGFSGGQGVGEVEWIWEGWVGGEEKRRLGKLEWLDEVERELG